jgi:flavin reductase (DIM6/NTAB) family NADH-FMN oxidoreductase RutF
VALTASSIDRGRPSEGMGKVLPGQDFPTMPGMAAKLDAAAFKRALGRWTSGVTIVTSRYGDLRHGMTVSAFCSVSTDPPQVLICANRESRTRSVIRKASAFSVSILARDQEALADLFADKSREQIRFDGLDCATGVTGCPRIPGALVHLDCEVLRDFESGTHSIFIGRVRAIETGDGEPLVFYRGKYVRLS